MDSLCFQPFCCKKADYKCECSIRQKFCNFHASNHMHFLDNEFFIEKIHNDFECSNESKSSNNIKSSNNTESTNEIESGDEIKCSEYPPKNLSKRPDKNVIAIVKQIYAKISCLQKIKIKSLKVNQRSSYCIGLLKNELLIIEEHENYLSQLVKGVERSASINELPESLIKIITNIENIETEIEFLEKLNQVIKLECEIKNHWLAKIIETPEKVEKLRFEFNIKISDIENWCFQHRNLEDSKIVNLINKLTLIKELIQNNFEVKHFFRVNQDCLQVYGAESWQKSEFHIISEYFKIYKYSPSIELPNSKVFCILKAKCTCIIDLKTMRISKVFPNISVCEHFALVYYENSVFVFGTSPKSCNLKYLKKYDLTRGIKIDLPRPSMNTSCHFYCVIYRNSIIFCMKDSLLLYKFDLIINSYSYLSISGMNSLSLKFLFTGSNRAYAVDTKSGVFESEIDNEYIWNKISSYEIYYYAEGIHVSSTNSVYFSIITENYSMNIYKFDLNSKKLFEIESV